MTPQEALASGAISPAQYLKLQQGAMASSFAGAGLKLPPPGVPTPPAGPPQVTLAGPSLIPGVPSALPGAAPPSAFNPSAPPAAPALTPMPSTTGDGLAGTVPNPHYTSPLKQAQAAIADQGIAVTAPALTGAPKRLVMAGAPGVGGAPGVAEAQGAPTDPLASILRPGGAGAAHAVGYSAADKARIGQLGQEEKSAEQSAADLSAHVGNIANAFGQQSTALAADTQQGLAQYQQQMADNAKRRAQIDSDAKQAQSRIQSEIADMQANGVDPNRYFHEQSTGGKILGALAVGLGAFAAHGLGPNGHESTNTALEIMNNAITRDIDAQKTNLAKSIDLTKFGASVDATGFDHQKALLEAERDSIQSAYAVAMNETAKRAAMFRDNADVQTRAAQITDGLDAARQARVAQMNEQIYGIQKGAERVVGGGGSDVAKLIRERSIKIRDDAAAHGKDISPEEAHRQAALDVAGVDVAPGTARASYAAEPKNAKGPTGKSAEQLAAINSAVGNIDQLIKMRQGAGLVRGAENNATAQSLSLATRTLIDKGLGGRMSPELLDQFGQMVPKDPLEHNAVGLLGSDPTMARMQAAKQLLIRHRDQIQANPGSAAEEDTNPAGLEERDK